MIEEEQQEQQQVAQKEGKVQTVMLGNKEIHVKIPYYLSNFEPSLTAETKEANVVFLVGKKVFSFHAIKHTHFFSPA